MIRPVAFLKWCVGLAFLAVAGASFIATPANADSFSFGYSSGYYRPYHHFHHHPHFGSRVIFVAPPPVYYPPPRVVYAPPPPVVYAPAPPPVVYAPAPIDAVPASAPYRTSSGQYCREYQAQVVVGGVARPSYGTACQQPDGSWRVVN